MTLFPGTQILGSLHFPCTWIILKDTHLGKCISQQLLYQCCVTARLKTQLFMTISVHFSCSHVIDWLVWLDSRFLVGLAYCRHWVGISLFFGSAAVLSVFFSWWIRGVEEARPHQHIRPHSSLHRPHLLTFHWPSQVTWPNPKSGMGQCPQPAAKPCRHEDV